MTVFTTLFSTPNYEIPTLLYTLQPGKNSFFGQSLCVHCTIGNTPHVRCNIAFSCYDNFDAKFPFGHSRQPNFQDTHSEKKYILFYWCGYHSCYKMFYVFYFPFSRNLYCFYFQQCQLRCSSYKL